MLTSRSETSLTNAHATHAALFAPQVMAEFGPALVEVRIAPPLHCPCPYLARLLPEEQRILGPDNRLARILTAKIEESADANSIALPLHHESETEQAAPRCDILPRVLM